MDFAVPADYRVKLKENVKKDEYLDFAKELKKLWNMKMMFIPIVIGALGTVSLMTGRLGNKMSWDHSHYYIMARILRKVLETWGDLLSLKLQWKTIS